MLRRMFAVAALYVRITARRRAVLVQMILVPLLLTYVLGKALGTEQSTGIMSVTNYDTGVLGGKLLTLLQRTSTVQVQEREELAAQESVRDGTAIAALIIPADFTSRVQAGETADIAFTGQETTSSMAARQALDLALAQFQSALAAASSTAGVTAASEQETAQLKAIAIWRDTPPVVVAADGQNVALPQGNTQSSAGLMVMFAMFFALGGGMTLLQERTGGTLRRLLVMPAERWVVLSGKLIGIFLTCVLQIGILIAAGTWFFGVDWGRSPVGLAALIPAYALTVTAFSLMLAALVRSVAQLQAISTLIVMAMSALGGAWWPLDIVPAWLRMIGQFTPTFWAIDGFQDLLTRGLGIAAILPNVAILSVFTLAFMALGVWRFRYE